MVALNTAYAPSKALTRSENRVGDFFCEVADCVGEDGRSTRKRIGEKRGCSYDLASSHCYGPFGELIRATGEKKDDFNYRFTSDVEGRFRLTARRLVPRLRPRSPCRIPPRSPRGAFPHRPSARVAPASRATRAMPNTTRSANANTEPLLRSLRLSAQRLRESQAAKPLPSLKPCPSLRDRHPILGRLTRPASG